MHCSLKVLAIAALLGVSAQAGQKEDKPKDPSKELTAKTDATSKSKGDKAKGDKSKGESKNEGSSKMSIPLTKDHPSIGLKIPYFGSDGKLQMNFNIGVANRLDDNHVKMDETQVETFNDGKSDMIIDLPSSVLDLTTRVITTNQNVKIKRADFEITGHTMEFNTVTKQGTIGGNVRMLIYNIDNESAEKKETKSSE